MVCLGAGSRWPRRKGLWRGPAVALDRRLKIFSMLLAEIHGVEMWLPGSRKAQGRGMLVSRADEHRGATASGPGEEPVACFEKGGATLDILLSIPNSTRLRV